MAVLRIRDETEKRMTNFARDLMHKNGTVWGWNITRDEAIQELLKIAGY